MCVRWLHNPSTIRSWGVFIQQKKPKAFNHYCKTSSSNVDAVLIGHVCKPQTDRIFKLLLIAEGGK